MQQKYEREKHSESERIENHMHLLFESTDFASVEHGAIECYEFAQVVRSVLHTDLPTAGVESS